MKAFIGVRKFYSELIQNRLGSYMYLTQALIVDFDLDCQNCWQEVCFSIIFCLLDNPAYAGYIVPPAPPRPDFDASREKLQKLGEAESGQLTKEEFNKMKQELEGEYLATFKVNSRLSTTVQPFVFSIPA